MTRRTWVADIWSDDDPAMRRMRDALALAPTPEPVQDAAQRPDPADVASVATPAPAPAEAPRENPVAALVRRVQAGDLSAVDMLRRLLDR
jgi:hypothetical protein